MLQIMISHIAVMLLTLATLTTTLALLSGLLFATVLQSSQGEIALAIARQTTLRGGAVERAAGQGLLDQIEQGKIQTSGEPALALLLPKRFAPDLVALVTPGRTPLARAANPRLADGAARSLLDRGLIASDWSRIERASALGRAGTIQRADPGRTSSEVIGYAPVFDRSGTLVAVALSVGSVFGGSQIRTLILGVFGAGTGLLLVAAGLPVVLISALFAYLLSRSLTRPLEAVSSREHGGYVALSVRDTGEGISSGHLPHIFERFYRVDEARTRGAGGAGLGLAIVSELVEMMGGRVTAESVPGEGSCFSVLLPVAAPPG